MTCDIMTEFDEVCFLLINFSRKIFQLNQSPLITCMSDSIGDGSNDGKRERERERKRKEKRR